MKHGDPLGERTSREAVEERRRPDGKVERGLRKEAERKGRANAGARGKERSAQLRWECTLLSKYKVKWQRIYAGIKVQLFGTICIT